MTDPWTIVGWLCVSILASFILLYLALALGVLCVTTRATWNRRRARRKSELANQGRLRCEWRGATGVCPNTATHKGARGYSCEAHIRDLGSVRFPGFASPLNWCRDGVAGHEAANLSQSTAEAVTTRPA